MQMLKEDKLRRRFTPGTPVWVGPSYKWPAIVVKADTTVAGYKYIVMFRPGLLGGGIRVSYPMAMLRRRSVMEDPVAEIDARYKVVQFEHYKGGDLEYHIISPACELKQLVWNVRNVNGILRERIASELARRNFKNEFHRWNEIADAIYQHLKHQIDAKRGSK